MKSENLNKISNQTPQQLPDGSAINLQFKYPANFKIGDQIEVTASIGAMQLFDPQHEEGCFKFDVQIWDDQFRLHCDHQQRLAITNAGEEVFTFRIREIELFPYGYNVNAKATAQNI